MHLFHFAEASGVGGGLVRSVEIHPEPNLSLRFAFCLTSNFRRRRGRRSRLLLSAASALLFLFLSPSALNLDWPDLFPRFSREEILYRRDRPVVSWRLKVLGTLGWSPTFRCH